MKWMSRIYSIIFLILVGTGKCRPCKAVALGTYLVCPYGKCGPAPPLPTPAEIGNNFFFFLFCYCSLKWLCSKSIVFPSISSVSKKKKKNHLEGGSQLRPPPHHLVYIHAYEAGWIILDPVAGNYS